jgi:hypothetical protein
MINGRFVEQLIAANPAAFPACLWNRGWSCSSSAHCKAAWTLPKRPIMPCEAAHARYNRGTFAPKMGIANQSSRLEASVKANAMMRWNQTGQLECVDVPV